MRKFVALIGVVLVLAGLRLFDNGALSLSSEGTLTVYGSGGTETIYLNDELPLFYRAGGYSRLDTNDDLDSVYSALKRIDAEIVRTETVGNITVIYAYAPSINAYVHLSGDVVNIMAAVSGNNAAYGVPLLKGSY